LKNLNQKDIPSQNSEIRAEENFTRINLNQELVSWFEKKLLRFDVNTTPNLISTKDLGDLDVGDGFPRPFGLNLREQSLLYFLQNGFFLSGGYARHIYILNDLLNSGKINCLNEALFLNFFNVDSDVDLWPKDETVLQNFRIIKPEKSVIRKFQSFAHNFYLHFENLFGQKIKHECSEDLIGVSISEKEFERYSTVNFPGESKNAGTKKAQVITAFSGRPEDVMGGFDIENCKFAVEVNQAGQLELVASKLAIEAERDRKLLLATRKPHNKHLALIRVKKYLQKFSKLTLHESSFTKLNEMVFEACIGEERASGWLESIFYFAENNMIDPTLVAPAIKKYSVHQFHKKSGCIFYSKHQIKNNPELFFVVSHGQKMPSESCIRGFDSHSLTAESKQVIALEEDGFSVTKSIKKLVNEDNKIHLMGESYSELYEEIETSSEFVALINTIKQNNNKFNRTRIYFTKITPESIF
jgi:hypothetical protein